MLIAMTTYDTPENKRAWMTGRTFNCLMDTVDHKKHRIIIVDNGSTDEQTRKLLEFREAPGWLVIFNGKNLGTAKAINKAWAMRQPGEHCIKMDNDVVIHDTDWVERLELVFAKDSNIGIAALKRRDLEEHPDHKSPHYKSTIRMLPHVKGEPWLVVEECHHIMGTCEAFSSACLDRIGYLYQMGALYAFDDSIACHRAQKAGLETVYLHGINIDHIDPGGDKYCEWKANYAKVLMPQYDKLMDDISKGRRSYYFGPEEV